MELLLDISEEELTPMAREAVADEVSVDGSDKFVKIEDQSEIEKFEWFEIPAVILNSRGAVRLVPREECARLMNDFIHDD